MKSILKNEAGFTLLEMLVSLLISSVIILFLVAGINQAHTIRSELIVSTNMINKETYVGHRQIEFHMFLNQLETLLEGTINPIVGDFEIFVDEWNEERENYEKVIYRSPKSNTSRIIRVKNFGNEPLLTGVLNKFFRRMGNWLFIDITFQNGETYSAKIWVASWGDE